jgi:tRNA pseudouridine65 synthase
MDVLYRDAVLAVLAKPSGLLVHRGWAGWGEDEEVAVTRARERLGAFVYPVHRLDRGASGALAFALSAEVAALLHAAFEDGRVHKRYLAAVRGTAPASVLVDHAIPRREGGPRVPAVTEVRLLAAAGGLSLVEAVPRTGRLHQVRRHLKHLGHPVLGDANYGKGALNRRLRDEVGLARLALHAAGLHFAHPTTGALVDVAAPLPDDLEGPLARLGILPGALP